MSACAALAAGLLVGTGCATDSRNHLDGNRVDISENDQAVLGPFVSRDVSLVVLTGPKTTDQKLTERVAQTMGSQLKNRLRARGHRVLPTGGALVEFRVSLKEYRPYKDKALSWRAYEVTADVQVPVAGGAVQRWTFNVDGRNLGKKKYYIDENAALAPVQDELMKQVDEWISAVLSSAPAAAR